MEVAKNPEKLKLVPVISMSSTCETKTALEDVHAKQYTYCGSQSVIWAAQLMVITSSPINEGFLPAVNDTCGTNRAMQDPVPWCPALQLTSPRSPTMFSLTSSLSPSKLWALQYFHHRPHHGTNPPSMTQLCPVPHRHIRNQTVLSDPPAESRQRCAPSWQELEYPRGDALLPSGIFPSWELGDGAR